MSKILSKTSLALVLGGTIAISGCSSDDDGGPAVPTNAASISSTNAMTLIQQATLAGTALTAAGRAAESGGSCDGGGTAILLGDSSSTSFSGTMEMSNCGADSGVTHVLNGSLNVSSSFDSSGDYSDSANGSVSLTAFGTAVSVSSISYAETGNETTLSFSINTMQFTYDPSGGGGFAAQLSSPITGTTSSSCPSSGSILLTGADGTQARGTISGSSVTIEYNSGSGFQTLGSDTCTNYFI